MTFAGFVVNARQCLQTIELYMLTMLMLLYPQNIKIFLSYVNELKENPSTRPCLNPAKQQFYS